MTATWESKDALTGAYDRAFLQSGLQEALDGAREQGAPFALIIFDLDHFKSVNDAFGHERGDQTLLECVKRVRAVLRSSERLFRYGGDEFVLILPGTTREQALRVADRMLQGIRSLPFPGEPPLTASITLGMAVFPADGETAEELFARADARLYAAKRAGRGRVVFEDASATGVHPLSGASRLIEREEALESLVTFLDALPGQRGIFAVTGRKGCGRSRFLVEAGNLGRLRGLTVLALHASEALHVRSRGALSEALADWGVLSQPSDEALIAELHQRVIAKGSAGLLLLVDNLAALDVDTLGFLRRLFAAGCFPSLGLVYSIDVDTVDRAHAFDTSLQRRVQLEPLTPGGLRFWLRAALRNEPAPAFVDWLHRETHGLPRLVENGLAELMNQRILSHQEGVWKVSPTYTDSGLGEKLAVKSAVAGHSLPVYLTSFVGRSEEIRLAKQRLESGQLLTFLGPGGSGKSRLAVQVASELAPRFSHGVRFIPLGSALSADEIIPTMMDALQITKSEKAPLRAQLLQYLQSKEMLLVLDTFEHLTEGADLVSEILQAAPQVHILVTSRERLHLPGEALLELTGLPWPEGDGAWPVRDEAALHLFLDRARLVHGEFAADNEIRWVVRICQLLQGMPLGIELAAAWVRTMTCEEIAGGIAQGLDFLATQQPHLAERHQSLRAVFDHSWHYLSPEERQIYSRLSVFRGGFSRGAAAQVAGASAFMLSALLDKSLVRRSASGRYEVHELLREYAFEALGPAQGDVRRAHADHCLAMAREAAGELEGPLQMEACDRLTAEHANLRAAMRWSLDGGEPERALLLAGALWRFWEMRGHVPEGRKWLEAALSASEGVGSPAARAAAHAALGHLLRRQGELQLGQSHLEEALTVWRDLGDEAGIAEGLEGLGYIAYASGDHPLALERLEESLRMMRAAGNRQGIIRVLAGIGGVAQSRGRFAEAIQLWEEGLQRSREIGNKYVLGGFLNNLSVTLTSMGEYDRARAYMVECLAINRELGGKPMIAAVLGNLGVVALIQGDLATAEAHLKDCLATAREMDWKIFVGIALGDLGLLARRRGNRALAAVRHGESLEIVQALGFKLGIAYYLMGMAGAAAADEPEEAVRLLGAAESLLEAIQSTPDLVYKHEREYTVATVRAVLDEPAFAAAHAAGRALTLEQVIALATATGQRLTRVGE